MQQTKQAIYNLWRSLEIDEIAAINLLNLIGHSQEESNKIILSWKMAEKYM